MADLTLVRNATVELRLTAGVVLVDPMLNPAGAVEPVAGTAPPLRNPLVELPRDAAHWARRADVVLVTHLHNDHFDAAARSEIPPETPVLCQPVDAARIEDAGFAAVRPVEDTLTPLPGVAVTRVPARHTLGEHAAALGPGSGYVIRDGATTLYVAGDCVWSDELRETLDRHAPDVVVLNGGAARFETGAPISMTADDVVLAARAVPAAEVVVVHLEALNHCPMTREDLRRQLVSARLDDRVRVPEDGETLADVGTPHRG